MIRRLPGSNIFSPWLALAFVSVGLIVSPVLAAPLVFTVDSSRSSVTLSGTVETLAIQAQATGSLTTSLNGSINADLTGSTINFTGGTVINAETNGVWQPAVGGASGNAVGDYGGKASPGLGITAYAALRNIVLNLNSSALTLSGNNFDSTALVFGLTNSSSLDYNASFLGSGTEILNDLATNSVSDGATLTTSGSLKTITIQISTTFTFTGSVPAVLTLSGQLVATNAPNSVFMINSLGITNQMLVLTVQNATAQSVLQSSTNLTSWGSAGATMNTNSSGATFYSVPIGTSNNFFRVQQ